MLFRSSTTITVSFLYYAGGGAGSAYYGNGQFTYNIGGLGGGGNGGGTGAPTNAAGVSGLANTGGGGGGGSGATSPGAGGNGGSGVVILSVPTVYYSGNISGSPTINQTNSVGYTILTYTQSGSYTA